MEALLKSIKEILEGITTVKSFLAIIIALIGIAGAVITFDSRYAHAEDISKAITNQEATLKAVQRQQKANILFQLEYYDNKIKSIEREQQELTIRSKSPQRSTIARVKEDAQVQQNLQRQKEEMIQRKEFITKSLLE